MTVGEIDPIIFGGLLADVKTLLAHQSEIKSDLGNQQAEIKKDLMSQQAEIKTELAVHQKEIKDDLTVTKTVMFAKIDKLSATVEELKLNGCTVGKQHATDIAALKDRPRAIVGLWVSVASLLTAACAVLALVWKVL